MDVDLNDYNRIAHLYDHYVQVDRDLSFFAEVARDARAVLELMAGTGRVSVPLAKATNDLTCVDSSAGMLRGLARKEMRSRPKVVCADVRYLPLPRRFDLVVIPFNSLAELVNEDDRRRVIGEVYRVLTPGGRFVCTLHNPTVRAQSLDSETRVLGTFPLPGGERLRVTATGSVDITTWIACSSQTYVRTGADDRVVEELTQDVRFALIGRKDFETMAVAEGFEIVSMYGDYDRSPFDRDRSPFMVWELRRQDA